MTTFYFFFQQVGKTETSVFVFMWSLILDKSFFTQLLAYEERKW